MSRIDPTGNETHTLSNMTTHKKSLHGVLEKRRETYGTDF